MFRSKELSWEGEGGANKAHSQGYSNEALNIEIYSHLTMESGSSSSGVQNHQITWLLVNKEIV